MKVWACGSACGSHLAYDFTFLYRLTLFHADFAHVTEHGDHALTVIDIDHLPIEEKVSGEYDLACGGGLDGGSFWCSNV